MMDKHPAQIVAEIINVDDYKAVCKRRRLRRDFRHKYQCSHAENIRRRDWNRIDMERQNNDSTGTHRQAGGVA